MHRLPPVLGLLAACGGTDDSAKGGVEPPDTSVTWADCTNYDLGSAVGDALATDENIFFENAFSNECVASTGHDASFAWVAPGDGVFVANSQGTEYDTVMMVYSGACPGDGDLLDCNDDTSGMGSLSQVSVTATAGDAFVWVLDAFADEDRGTWVFNLNPE